jgi:hypothetical protein
MTTTHQEDNLKITRVGLLVLLVFFSTSVYSKTLKVALIDTNYCIKKSINLKNVKILTPIDTTKSNSKSCNDYSIKNRKYHGQWVLNQMLSNLNQDQKIEITPYIVYNSSGVQQKEYWQEALKNQSQFHLIVMAAGLINEKGPKLEVPVLVAGATYGRGISKKTTIWPQSEFKNSFVFTIGSYLEKTEELDSRGDFNLIHKDQMKYFFSSGPDGSHLQGTSRAVATAAAKAISLCYETLLSRGDFAKCLEKNKVMIKLKESNKEVPSF